AAGARLVAGRALTWNALYGRRPVVLVSENLASELWGAPQAALGRRITTGADFFEVVGVVQDVRDNGLREPPPAIVYWPPLLENFVPTIPILVRRTVTVVVRSPLTGTEALTRDVQRAVWSVNANLPVASMRTMQEVLDESMART